LLAGQVYSPTKDGKVDFNRQVLGVDTFSEKEYFKTIFVLPPGKDLEIEKAAEKAKLIEDWNKKVVVKNTHFAVNTKILES